MKRPCVIEYPESLEQLKRGFDQLADLLAVTLGPSQGSIFSSTDLKSQPEMLTDAATIARRVTQLPDPRQNVGAMLLRNLVWRMHQRVGDGGALAAVLAQSLLHQSLRFVTAGANPLLVMNGLKRGAKAALDHLTTMSQPVQGEADLFGVALAVTGEPKLSLILGEMFNLLGWQGHVTVEDYMAPYLERAYLDGGRWQGSLISPYLINVPEAGQAILQDLQVVLFDGRVTTAEEVRPVLDHVSKQEPPQLLFVAQAVSGEALNLLVATDQQTNLKVIAVSLKRSGEKADADLEDLACLSGATLISPQTGRKLELIKSGDFGSARRAEAGMEDLLVSGGGGDPLQVASRIEVLQRRLQALPFGDVERAELEMRLGRLSGNAGILKIGAYTQVERDYLHQKAVQCCKVLRAALEEGVLPGGGVSYLHCIKNVQQQVNGSHEDEALGVKAVVRALEAPFRCILKNASVPTAALILQEIVHSQEGIFYNVLDGQIVEARQAGILDATKVLRVALETATSGAAMALSTQTLILKKKPVVSYEP